MLEYVPDILTTRQCCELLQIGKNTLFELLSSGELTGFKIGNRWKIPKENILEYIYHKL